MTSMKQNVFHSRQGRQKKKKEFSQTWLSDFIMNRRTNLFVFGVRMRCVRRVREVRRKKREDLNREE